MGRDDMKDVATVKLRFKGHGKATTLHGRPDEKTNLGGHNRYLGYDPGLKREVVCDVGDVVTVSDEKAEQLLDEVIGHGEWEKVGGKDTKAA